MRQLRYSIAPSLDGYIAGTNGDFDWIVIDPDIDFAAMYAGFSALVMGRRSYDVYISTGGAVGPALPTYVYSRSLPEGERNGVTFVADAVPHVACLKETGDGKPLWLWGGGELFRELAEAGWWTAWMWPSSRCCRAGGFRCCRCPPTGCRSWGQVVNRYFFHSLAPFQLVSSPPGSVPESEKSNDSRPDPTTVRLR